MNELTTEKMEERIRNVKEYMYRFFSHDEHKDHVIFIGAGHTQSRLELACQKISTDVVIITPDRLTDICEKAGRPIDDILALIEAMRVPARTLGDDLRKMALAANTAAIEVTSLSGVLIDDDNRPFYQKIKDKGGKKRKQNYSNRQPWRR